MIMFTLHMCQKCINYLTFFRNVCSIIYGLNGIAVGLCVLSPGGSRCSSRPCASSICPVRRTQPQPLSVVRAQLPRGGKPRLYVSHRRETKERRNLSLSPDTVTRWIKITWMRPFQMVWGPNAQSLTLIFELVGLSEHDHRRTLAKFRFLLEIPAWKIQGKRETGHQTKENKQIWACFSSALSQKLFWFWLSCVY